MSEEAKRGLTLFLEFWLLIALLAGFNFYSFFRGGSKAFLAVGMLAAAVWVGWALFYLFYVRPAGKETTAGRPKASGETDELASAPGPKK